MPIFLKSNLIHKLIYWFCFLLISKPLFSNGVGDSDSLKINMYVISASTQYGFIIIHRSYIQHFSQTHFSVFQTTILKQTNGNKLWQKIYHQPRYGINLLFTNFAGNTLLHQAFGAQGFIDFCKHPKKKNTLHFKMGCGIGYIQTPFNSETNFKNSAIGSHFNGLVQLGFYQHFKLSTHLQSSVGLSLIHFSNGAIRVPNLGINIVTAGVGISLLNRPLDDKIAETLSDNILQKKYVELTISAGIKQNYPIISTTFGVVAARAQYYFRNKLKHNWSAGLDVFYDNGLYHKMTTDDKPTNDKKTALQLGLNLQYQQNIGRISIPIFMGVYSYTNYKGNGLLYHGFGVKYRITDKLSAALILKTHFARADYFLWSICYKI